MSINTYDYDEVTDSVNHRMVKIQKPESLEKGTQLFYDTKRIINLCFGF